MDWARRVHARRDAVGLTQSKLAEIVGVTQPTISSLERGRYVPSDDLKWRLAGALGCLITELFPFPAHRPPFPVAA